jgi:hypothetical protein
MTPSRMLLVDDDPFLVNALTILHHRCGLRRDHRAHHRTGARNSLQDVS